MDLSKYLFTHHAGFDFSLQFDGCSKSIASLHSFRVLYGHSMQCCVLEVGAASNKLQTTL